MNRFGVIVFSVVSIMLTFAYTRLMNVMLHAIFGSGEPTMLFKVFATLMFPSSFALFLLMVFLTYHFIARALKMYVDMKWALYMIAVCWLFLIGYIALMVF